MGNLIHLFDCGGQITLYVGSSSLEYERLMASLLGVVCFAVLSSHVLNKR